MVWLPQPRYYTTVRGQRCALVARLRGVGLGVSLRGLVGEAKAKAKMDF